VLRRRRTLVVLALVAVLAAGGAVVFYLNEIRAPGDVFNPDVPFEDTPEETPEPEPTPEPDPRRPQVDRFVWPQYGYSDTHRRVFQPRKPLEGPFRRVWRRKATELLEFPPVIARGTLFQLADDGWLVARDKDTGRRRWRRKVGTLGASSPAVDGRNLYVTVLETPNGGSGRALSLRMRDGRIRWSRALPSRSESSPLVEGNRMYFGSEDGTVYSVGKNTGRIMWRYRAAGSVKGSPTLYDGLLYFGDYGGQVQAIRASTGRRVWANGAAQGLVRTGTFYATAAVAFGRVYIGSTDGRQYSFSARDGSLAWAHQTGNYVYSSAAVQNVPRLGPTVFFGSYDSSFYALNARNGAVRWRWDSGGRISGSPTIVSDTVYFASLGRRATFGLNVRTGRRVFGPREGGYDPVVSDGTYLFLTGYRTISALLPQPEFRRRRQAARQRRAERRAERRRAARERQAERRSSDSS
jgi:outer membrane protein assembly factor BamB